MVVALQSSFKADYIATLLIFGFKYTLIKVTTFSFECTRKDFYFCVLIMFYFLVLIKVSLMILFQNLIMV